ncbi:flagellar assembly protein FliH [Azotobacter bryophylli]|uniref:Flagellar assembly protein FliH n=1 Tax=Azotobacter bryophylli TaxID=1986537 RepID=A0ABV7AUV6_9GAMM
MSDRPSWPGAGEQWRPWQMEELGRPQESRPDPERQRREALRQQALKREAELQAQCERARQEAGRQGYEEGFAAARNEGYARGLEEGRQAGEQELREQTRAALEPLLELGKTFRQALDQLDGDIAERLVDLALAAARQLAGEALEAHPEQILPLIRELLHSEPALSGKPRLWLHPADLALVKARLGDELEAAGWQLQPDASISRGGCRISSASGELDATWEARWARVVSQVRRRHQQPETDAEDGA